MFFLLGGYIRKNSNKFAFIKWKTAIVMCIVYSLFYCLLQKTGIYNEIHDEYFFGSIICMLYAISVFCACINTKIEKSKVITKLSSMFLPVYAFHLTIMLWISRINLIETLTPVLQYIVALLFSYIINISISYVLVKTPYIKDIFKI